MTEKLLNGCLKGSKVVEPKADYDECAIWSETLWSGIISLLAHMEDDIEEVKYIIIAVVTQNKQIKDLWLKDDLSISG